MQEHRKYQDLALLKPTVNGASLATEDCFNPFGTFLTNFFGEGHEANLCFAKFLVDRVISGKNFNAFNLEELLLNANNDMMSFEADDGDELLVPASGQNEAATWHKELAELDTGSQERMEHMQ